MRGRLTTLAYRAAARGRAVVARRASATPARPASAAGSARWPHAGAAGAMAARHQRRAATGAHRRRAPSTSVFESYGALLARDAPAARRRARRRRCRRTSRSTATSTSTPGSRAGKGVILALPHLGGWEWAAAWMARAGPPTCSRSSSASSRPSCSSGSPTSARRSGIEVVPLGPDVVDARCCGRCATTASCACCATATSTGDGVEVEFFGERTTLPGGPATLALRTGATLLPAAVYFRPGRDHLGVVRPPLPVERDGPPARRHRADHPGARARVRGADPRGARAVAPAAAELAERPRIGS